MELQPNWPRIQQRMTAFWEGEVLDGRAMFYVMAPRQDVRRRRPEPPSGGKLAEFDYFIDQQLAEMEVTYYGGDALPALRLCPPGYPVGMLIGARYKTVDGVDWAEPFVADWESTDWQLRVHWESDYWKSLVQLMRIAGTAAKGKCLVTLPAAALHGLDAMAYVRSTEELCLDLVQCPDVVWRNLLRLNSIWAVAYETMWRTLRSYGAEVTDMLPLWCPQRFSVLQSDISVMLSPPMFREFVQPDLASCAAFLDRTLFHLDGEEMLQHLDALLEIEHLHAIQFQQGNTYGEIISSALPYIPVLRKIQEAGKCVYISCMPDEVEPLMRELSSRRLFIATATRTEAQAKELEKLVEALTHD
jgi:hypothetical protein